MKRRRKIQKKVCLLLWAVPVLVILSVFFALQKPVPEFAKERSFPVGEKLVLSDLVTGVKNGSLLESERVIDSSREGEVTVSFLLKSRLGAETREEITVTFYASEKKSETKEESKQKPTIEGPEEISVYTGEEISLSAFCATDAKGNSLTITVKENVNTKTEGTFSLTLQTRDSDGVEVEKIVKLSVLKSPFAQNTTASNTNNYGVVPDGTYPTKNGKTLIVKNGLATVDGILIANKSYALPKTYTSSYLTPEAEQAYYRMRTGAQKEGFTLSIKSAYRSWNDQNYIFNGYVKDDGLEEALTFSARPGHSEHQTGLGMDLLTASSEEAKTPQFKPTLDWLKDNAQNYGFILRYPEGKSDITGYIYEPWHYRYVGEDLAKTLYNGGDWITLEEYFGIDSIYRGYN